MSPSASVSFESDALTDGGLEQSLRHTWLIARTEFRRTYRQLADNPRQLVGLAVSGLFLCPVAIVGVGGAYEFGTAVGTDAFVTQLSVARMIVTMLAALVASIVMIATAQEYGTLEESEAVLTAIPYQEAVLGLLLSSYITFAGPAALPIIAVAVAFSVGAGSLASIPVIVGVLLGILAFATTVGFVLGQIIRTLGARLPVVARYKTIIGVLVFVAYFAVITTGVFEALLDPISTVIEATPFGWFVDLALIAAPTSAIGLVRPAAAAVILFAGTTSLGWVAIRLSGALWYTEPVQPSENTSTNKPSTDDTTTPLAIGHTARLFERVVSRPTVQIAQKSWRRTYRAPMRLQYAAIPAFFLMTPIQQSIQSGEISIVLPSSVAIYGAWAAGAAFTLNPLGDEGSVLPITLTAGVSGQQLLSGVVFAGIVAGGPLTVLLTGGLGLASQLDAVTALATAALGGVLCIGACTIGASVGTAFPKFEHTRISRSREAIIPSFSAFVVYSLILFAVSLPGLLGGIPVIARWFGEWIGHSPQAITLVGLAVTTLLSGVTGWIGLRSAVTTIDGYTPDR